MTYIKDLIKPNAFVETSRWFFHYYLSLAYLEQWFPRTKQEKKKKYTTH